MPDDAQHATTTHDGRVRLSAFALMCVALSVKGDGTFPLSASTPEWMVQAVTTFFGAVFFTGMYFFVYPRRMPERWARLITPPVRLATWVYPAAFIIGCAGITMLEARRFSDLGYRFEPIAFTVAVVVPLLLAGRAIARRGDARRVFATGLAAFLCFTAYAILFFPLAPARSDMLPLIHDAMQRVFAGSDPYVFYERVAGIPLTYLPGLWLAFIPGAALGLDPRWTELLAVAAAVLVLYKGAVSAGKAETAACAAMFLATPYLIYRHEIYIGVLLLSLALTARQYQRRRWLAAGLFFGWSIATSQFAWVVAPLLAIHAYRTEGWRPTAVFAAASALVAVAIVAPWAWMSPMFFHSVLFSWSAHFDLSGFNLTYWVYPLFGMKGLVVIQILSVALCYFAAIVMRPDARRTMVLTACALACFFLFNRVVWVYFFLTIPFLLMATRKLKIEN